MIPVSYNLRNLTVRKATTLATALGIGLVVFVFSAVMMLSNGIKKTLGKAGRTDNAIVLRKGSAAELESGIEEGIIAPIRSREEVATISESGGSKPVMVSEVVLVITVDKLGTKGGVSNVTIRGVPADVLAFRPEVKLVAGVPAKPGTNEVIIGKQLNGRFTGMELGKTFDLRKNRPVTVVGIFDAGGSAFESEVWADVDTVRSAYGREGMYSSVRVRLTSPDRFDAFKTALETDKNLGFLVSREDKYYETQSEGMAMFISALGILISFCFGVGAMIGAAITMYASVANRNKEIGTLRALGFSRGAILFSFLMEAMVLCIGGGLVGALAALAMSTVKFSMMNFNTFSEVVFSFDASPGILIGSLIFAAFMGLVGGLFPAIRASRMSPIQAMRG
jgi:putative ABC transport system permease protein